MRSWYLLGIIFFTSSMFSMHNKITPVENPENLKALLDEYDISNHSIKFQKGALTMKQLLAKLKNRRIT